MGKLLFKIAKKLKLTDEIKYYRKKGVQIGENVRMYNVRIDEGHGYLVKVGDECILTNCTILAHDASTQIYYNKTKVGKVEIGNRCFIGLGSIILPNVRIGDDCIVGAGTVVTKDIPKESIVVGNPARIISSIDEFKEKHENWIKEKPLFDKYWKYKTEEEKTKEREELKNDFGYDE